MDHQTVKLGVWIGGAALAFIWANISVRHARHLLTPGRRGVHLPVRDLGSSVIADQTGSGRQP